MKNSSNTERSFEMSKMKVETNIFMKIKSFFMDRGHLEFVKEGIGIPTTWKQLTQIELWTHFSSPLSWTTTIFKLNWMQFTQWS